MNFLRFLSNFSNLFNESYTNFLGNFVTIFSFRIPLGCLQKLLQIPAKFPKIPHISRNVYIQRFFDKLSHHLTGSFSMKYLMKSLQIFFEFLKPFLLINFSKHSSSGLSINFSRSSFKIYTQGFFNNLTSNFQKLLHHISLDFPQRFLQNVNCSLEFSINFKPLTFFLWFLPKFLFRCFLKISTQKFAKFRASLRWFIYQILPGNSQKKTCTKISD